jgi:BMFP domain-containing protein YqiC
MANPKILDEIGSRVSDLLASSPARDLEKNARALLASGFSKLDLVTREEFDVQKDVLARTREKLTELEHRVASLEAELARRPPAEGV